ncbi:MAG TPA: Ldh family oxidoreductase [Capillimicrobium sp.]|nr:Ldh family oxidoreductase [Capillimicrobium sp.]
MPTFAASQLETFAAGVLAALGMPDDHARTTAACLVAANLRGLDSHGVLRLLQYEQSIAAGEVRADAAVEVVTAQGASALVDAGGGYGYVPTLLAADLAAECARRHGVGVAGVRHSHHFGMGASYVERLAGEGLIGLVLTNTGPVMSPPGVRVPLVGNNPIAVGIPRRAPHPPIVLDMALSQTAFGRIRLAAAEGREIPLGWAHDRDGQPTTDAGEALAAALLAPAGGHKGFALAFVVDLLTGALTGSRSGTRADAHAHPEGGVAHLVLALSPALFLEPGAYTDAVEGLVADLMSHDAPGAPVLLPGDKERATAAARSAGGIPVSEELLDQLRDQAERLGVAPPVVGSHG